MLATGEPLTPVSSPDVNECLANPCGQECVNMYGSYQCYCNQGYHLREDGHTCEGAGLDKAETERTKC